MRWWRPPAARRSSTSPPATTTGWCRPATAGRRHVAGAIGVSTDAQASWWGGRGIGTVPHGLIAAYGGDTVKAARKFADRYHEQMNVTVLVDFVNDSVRDRFGGGRGAGPKLWGVRLDTSEQLVDRSLFDEMGGFTPTGVNRRLVEKVRGALDGGGLPRRQDRRLRWVHGGADPRVRSARRARRRLRRRLVADPRQQRLHRGRGAVGRSPVREGRALVFAQSPPATRRVGGENRVADRSYRWSGQ